MTVHHAPLPRVAALPPFIPPSRPAAHQAQPITILRGGPFIHVPQRGRLSAAAALAPPPPGIRIMRGTRSRPIAGAGFGKSLGQSLGQTFRPPGPLILHVQN